jgi:hypothetical protein
LILPYTTRAAHNVDALVIHYLNNKRPRPEAVRGLLQALTEASAAILARTATVYDAPRPYPELKQSGAYWVYFEPYWIAYRRPKDPVISSVFYDKSNIPGRL